MALKLTNNAVTTLAASITSAATSISIQTADAGKFPVLGAGDWHPATIIDPAGNMEIVRVTARNTGLMTVARAQEGTTAKAFAAGSRVDVRLTVAAINEILSGDHTHTMDQIIGLIDALNARVSDAGDTMTGALNLPEINVKGAAGSNRSINFRTADAVRWSVGAEGSAETGGNNGSVFAISRFTDAGNYIDSPFYMSRTTGLATFQSELVVRGQLAVGINAGGLEVGPTNGSGGPAYIDFHTSTTPVDYNARIIASGPSAGLAGASLNIECTGLTVNNQNIWSTGNLGYLAGGEAEAGTSETKRVWSAADVKRAINALTPSPPPAGIGNGQSWQAPSRTALTVYQNTTGKPIMVSISWTESNNVARYLRIGDTAAVGGYVDFAMNGSRTHADVIIPNGHYYYMDNANITAWLELR